MRDNGNRQARRENATEREGLRSNVSDKAQLSLLDKRPGNSKRERTRLLARLSQKDHLAILKGKDKG